MRVSCYLLAGSLFLLGGCQSLDLSGKNDARDTEEDILLQEPTAKVEIQPEEIHFPVAATDVWQRLRDGMALPVPDIKRVNDYRNWYRKHPKHLEQVSARAEPYLHFIVEELDKRGLPLELALLPIVESAFDPMAYSHGAASGLWQFTTPMARYFGLKMNWWYDGRRDVPAATLAALDMMEYLYRKTGNNWLYAIAAYNTGEGRVLSAVQRNKKKGLETDFWSLDLPTETERYVPQLLALADVVRHSDDYGISLAPITNEAAIKVVDVGSQIDLALVAEAADMSLGELQALNPGFNRWATPPKGPHKLVLPVDRADAVAEALTAIPANERISWLRYEIKPGDSLSTIADRFHTTAAVIKSLNQLESNQIRAGKHLMVPASARAETQTLPQLASRPKGKVKLEYKVSDGDSLWLIAKKHSTSVNQLIKWNRLDAKGTIRPGQTLVLWQQSNTAADRLRKVNYKVRSGDSLARIAKKFKVKVADLINWNGLGKDKYLKPGQMLKLYVDVIEVSS
ncbi:lytic transglycosylase [Shewanella sedimentimangrovi]|uniref:LysM peptidoglycan-binding domain-containing protein n=1 Tax=Shewanella sedimentimangrovi TaxID=2814293 RepID=A0ABX7R6B0_9GAMM|nr:LysM peptidoglycan-binding domain-containing protein [Shewanella sedimentimangrovi]QSX38797.1 LysM peptidoglycan-binding domain-containing protein [Shewanella sedimentimangrovi]